MSAFDLTNEGVDKIVVENTKEVSENPSYFWYLSPLKQDEMKSFLHFGADKAGTKDILSLLTENNLDSTIIKMTHPVIKYKIYNFLSKDRKLIVSFTSPIESGEKLEGDFYFHYLGVTGEKELVISFIDSFLRDGYYDEMCFGGRNFV